jgi:hypothetical protein
MSEVIQILDAIGRGDAPAAEQLLSMIYQELRRLQRRSRPLPAWWCRWSTQQIPSFSCGVSRRIYSRCYGPRVEELERRLAARALAFALRQRGNAQELPGEHRTSSDGSVTHWIGELQAGRPAAAWQLCQGYFRRLVALARLKLRGAMRGRRRRCGPYLSACWEPFLLSWDLSRYADTGTPKYRNLGSPQSIR